jgi:hypothetical protein
MPRIDGGCACSFHADDLNVSSVEMNCFKIGSRFHKNTVAGARGIDALLDSRLVSRNVDVSGPERQRNRSACA